MTLIGVAKNPANTAQVGAWVHWNEVIYTYWTAEHDSIEEIGRQELDHRPTHRDRVQARVSARYMLDALEGTL